MTKYLYEVSIKSGKNNPDFYTFLNNVQNLYAKAPDFGGIQNICLIGHSKNSAIVQMLCSEGMKNEEDVTVEEITRNTIENDIHHIYLDTIRNCFLPYDDYINIKE